MRHALIALFAGATLVAQGQQPTPVFRGGVNLVTVDVTVLDRDGKPIVGLTAADFEVKLNGQVKPVKAIDYLQAATTLAPAAPAVAASTSTPQRRRTVTNAPPKGESRVFVILVDDLSFDPVRGKPLFLAADRFVGKLPASDVVGFTTSSRGKTVNPTTDRTAVRAALRTVVGEFSDPRKLDSAGNAGIGGKADVGSGVAAGDVVGFNVGLAESLDVDQFGDTRLKDIIIRECYHGDPTPVQGTPLSALATVSDCASQIQQMVRRTASLMKATVGRQIQAYLDVINAMKAAPGIKQLVLITDGLGIGASTDSLATIAKAAASAGVQLSVLIEEPDTTMAQGNNNGPPTGGAGVPASVQTIHRADGKMLQAGAETISDVTGGNYQHVIGTPDPAFDRVAVASSALYRLGVDAGTDMAPGKDFLLNVSVKRPGATVHANRHAVAPTPPPAVPVDDQLKDAANAGPMAYGVPMSMATALRRGSAPLPPGATAGPALELGVNVLVPASVKGPLTTMFGIVDEAGNLRTGRRVMEQPAAGADYHVSFAVPVPGGKYRLRFAVVDAEGHLGNIESAGTAELSKLGPFLASDLLTLAVDASGKAQFFALDEVPAGSVALGATLELYPSTAGQAPGDVQVHIALMDGLATVEDSDVKPAVSNGALQASAQFPLASLPLGEYTVKATVLVGGNDVGSATTTVRKK